ncbi:phage tail protein I [Salmonella enterica]|nr:phage tail protein I [Salmonella enterica]
MAKKVSKFFRIGVEGDTCDGRVISAQDIQEMAETFDPRVYGCRINLEHLRGILPDGIFKGTIGAIRRVVEPLGYLIEVREWWQLNEEPGTFRIVVGVLEQGITEEMYQELERLVADAKPASRHLTGLAISLSTTGNIFAGAGCYHGDALTVYPYTPEAIIVGGDYFPASAIHLIDNLRVNA